MVSVLFADLVGFTSRSERLDIDGVRRTLVPYHATLRRVLERFGGTVEKFIGDAVMAVFGAHLRSDVPPRRRRAEEPTWTRHEAIPGLRVIRV